MTGNKHYMFFYICQFIVKGILTHSKKYKRFASMMNNVSKNKYI